MHRLKQLEDKNQQLKQIVADQTLDIQALKAVLARDGEPYRSNPAGVAFLGRQDLFVGELAPFRGPVWKRGHIQRATW